MQEYLILIKYLSGIRSSVYVETSSAYIRGLDLDMCYVPVLS